MRAAVITLILFSWAIASSGQVRLPVIDMHLHAGPGSENSNYYTLREGEMPDEARLRTLLADMEANNVVYGIVGGPPAHVERFRQAAPVPLIGSVILPCIDGHSPNFYKCYKDGSDWPDLNRLRAEVEAGRLGAVGELYNVYAGVSPLDPRMKPYIALAAKHDLVVAVHAERGPPPESPIRAAGCCPHFNENYGDPALWTDILEQYPDLRLVLYHAFRPVFVESAIALMDRYPNVVVETSPMSLAPTPWVHAGLRRYLQAGHADRVVFGSDYLGAIGESLAVIQAADFLNDDQKQAILYDNAARFLRLSKEEIARHHATSNSEKR